VELLVMGADDTIINSFDRSTIRNNLRNKYGLSEDDFLVITGGKINSLKNIHLLVEAVAKLSHPKIKLLCFGEFALDMMEYCTEYIKSESVIYAGWLDNIEIYKHLFASDLACFPGKHSVLWEQAVGCGLPCIFKRIEGHEHIDLGGNCLLLDEVSVLSLQKSIKSVFSSLDFYENMKATALDRGTKLFSYYNIAESAIN
jgi:glycosyltransferase involved in cell wall biosynthesis